MGVKFETIKNEFPKMETSLKGLNGKKINVGVLGGGDAAWLAGIHEYGCNIQAKRSQYLTIPCNRKAYGKRASDFSDLFFLELDSGEKFLVRNKGKDQLEFMFWLTKSVHIPERSFLRAGHDANIDKVLDKVESLLSSLEDGDIDADRICKIAGDMLSSKIKEFARDLNTPAKSNVTIEAEGGKTSPLVNTGTMIGSITYEVE